MPQPYSFRIDKAEANLDGTAVTVKLVYPPEQDRVEARKLPEDLDRGIEVFEGLLSEGHAEIGPIRSSSSGSLYRFTDGKVLVHRRDPGAPTHKMYHSFCVGLAAARGVTPRDSEEYMLSKGLVPYADESLLITRDRRPRLVVTPESRDYAREAARKLGLDLPIYEVFPEFEIGPDRLIAVDENGHQLFNVQGFIGFFYESQTGLNTMQIKCMPLSSEEVLPVDVEGMPKGGKWNHFNRESYFLSPWELDGKRFGDVLDYPEVYRTAFLEYNGRRVPIPIKQVTGDYPIPYVGPEMILVNHPHVFAPDDLLRRMLHAVGIEGYERNWMELELEITRAKKDGKPILPDEVLHKPLYE